MRAKRQTTCAHPERKHRAKGLCGACYERAHTSKLPGFQARKHAEKTRRHARNPARYRLQASVQNARKGGYVPLNCEEGWLNQRLFGATRCEFPTCGKPLPNLSDRHIDHDHRTGKFRGILCRRCNSAVIGAIESNLPAYLQYVKACVT